MLRTLLRIAAFVPLAWILGFVWFALWLPGPLEAETPTDGVVVLTGGEGRLERGLTVLERGEAGRMLISGVDRDVKRSELATLYGRDERIFRCCIDLGFRAVDTRSNARETHRWIEKHNVRSIRLVTSDWHMRRARLELDMALADNVRVVEDAVRSHPSLGTLFKEYNKYLLRLFAALLGM